MDANDALGCDSSCSHLVLGLQDSHVCVVDSLFPPQLHTHAVLASMVQGGGEGKWRTMVDGGLVSGKMAIGAIYRA